MKKRMTDYLKAQLNHYKQYEKQYEYDKEAFQSMCFIANEMAKILYLLTGKNFYGIDDIDRMEALIKEL